MGCGVAKCRRAANAPCANEFGKGSLKTLFHVFRLPLSRACYSALGFALKLFAVSSNSKNSARNPYSSGLAADFASAMMSAHVILPLYCPPCRAWAYDAAATAKRKSALACARGTLLAAIGWLISWRWDFCSAVSRSRILSGCLKPWARWRSANYPASLVCLRG